MKLYRSLLAIVCVVGVMSTGVERAKAALPGVPAIGYTTYTEGSFGGGDVTLGWEFTVTQPVGITGLGYYDYNSDGLVSSHEVGIFNLSGTLLVSASIPSGTVGELQPCPALRRAGSQCRAPER